jgi:hypothetical protein
MRGLEVVRGREWERERGRESERRTTTRCRKPGGGGAVVVRALLIDFEYLLRLAIRTSFLRVENENGIYERCTATGSRIIYRERNAHASQSLLLYRIDLNRSRNASVRF